ncbi:hypothetical protein [Paenibacillus oryzisoli]|uniref:Uncharacterized protein n=1 Tax=Paenibacillus oryzisoli TaxID=1850517 RepID=A0A198A8R8_9BACL|nr:hypothetical protein [Paenibacillus oryzisoli]OAS17466.1 hypothetical protein A8708_22130 [Paenibacillus oryzisoli]
MGNISLPRPEEGMSNEDIMDLFAKMSKTVEWLANGRIDSVNVREIGGFNVSKDTLKHSSGIVGMSSDGTDDLSIRFWAGSADPTTAPFRVQQDGSMYSTKGNIGGFVIGQKSLTDVAGTFGLSSVVTSGNDLRYWAGSATAGSAPFRVYEDGTVHASNLNITGGSINAGFDVTIGNKLHMNQYSFGNGIDWGSIQIYIDPAAASLRFVAPSGIYANGKRIDV